MIVEQRIHTLKPGMINAYLELYEAEGYVVPAGHLGPLAGHYTTGISELNQLIHMWACADLTDRQQRRSRLFNGPQWMSALTWVHNMIDHIENKILLPTSFGPVPRMFS